MRKLTVLIFFAFQYAMAQIWSAAPDNWSNAGYRGEIPRTFDYIINMKTEYGLAANGTTDDAPAIQQAITQKIPNYGNSSVVFFFPAGNYKLGSSIQIPSSASKIVIAGDGVDKTVFHASHAGKVFDINASSSQSSLQQVPTSLYSGYVRNSTSVTVPFTNIQQNDFLEIQVKNGVWHGHYAPGNSNPPVNDFVGQIVKVSAVTISGPQAILTLEEPLRLDYGYNIGYDGVTYDLQPSVRKMVPVNQVGFENFKLLNEGNGAGCRNFEFEFATDCWIWGVHSDKPFYAHIAVNQSSGIEIRGCFFHDAQAFGTGGQGYGIVLGAHSTDCLVEDNAFEHLRHAMMVSGGANGNVFGFNYSTDQYSPDEIDNGDISFHGTYPYDNLFEGNMALFADADRWWGFNGPRNTLFRNELRRTPTIFCFNLYDPDWYPSNNGGIRLLGPKIDGVFQGLDFYVHGNTYEEGGCWLETVKAGFFTNKEAPNNGYNAAIGHVARDGGFNPPGQGYSMYYAARPSFMTSAYTWPPVGCKYETNSTPSQNIPAKTRYFAGGTRTTIPTTFSGANSVKVNVKNDLAGTDNLGNVGAFNAATNQWSSSASPFPFYFPKDASKTIRTEETHLSYANVHYRLRNWDNDEQFHQSSLDIITNGDQNRAAIFKPGVPLILQASLEGSIGGQMAFRGDSVTSPYSDYAFTPPYSTSIGAPATQSLNGVSSIFLQWSDGPFERTRSISPQAATVYTAIYKMHLGSSVPTATGSTSQRKLVYCLSDKFSGYHLVYESMGDVWYARSTNGTTWSSEIRLSRGAGTAHNPAISELFEPYYGNSGIYVVWVDNTVRSGATGYDINVARLDPETNHWSPTEVIYDPSVPDAVGWAQAGAKPVASSFNDNSNLHIKVVVAYEGYYGTTAGIISSAKAYYFNTGTVLWSQNLVCAAGGRPSMAFESDAPGNLSLALTYDDGSNVYMARSGNTLYSPNGCAYVCFNTPITVPSSIAVSPVKNSTVCFDWTSGTIHVAWTGYALDYEMELTLERSQDLAGNWSSMNHFVSDLVEVPVVTASISGDLIDGPTMLFSDGKTLFNMYASSGTNWACKSLTSYSPSSATISSPNLMPQMDGAAASVLTFYSGSPSQLRFETRTNGGLQKTSQSDSLKPVTKIYRQLSIKDTTDGSRLSVQYGDMVLTNESGTTITNVAFEQSKNASKNSFVRTLPFQTGGNTFLDIQVKIDGQHWKKPGTVSFDLVDSASGKVLAALYTQKLLEGGGTQIEGRVKRNLQQLVGSRSVCIALHVDANDTAKFAVDYNQVYRIGANSGLAKIGELRQGEKYLAADNMPMEFRLLQNYPNPFNPSTQIAYQLKDAGSVHLAVYDMLGREVAVLVNEHRQAGYYSAVWNAAGLSSGAYIYRIAVKDENGKSSFNETKRMMLVK